MFQRRRKEVAGCEQEAKRNISIHINDFHEGLDSTTETCTEREF